MKIEDRLTIDQYIDGRHKELEDFKALCTSQGLYVLTLDEWRVKERAVDYSFWCAVCNKWRNQGCFNSRCSPDWK